MASQGQPIRWRRAQGVLGKSVTAAATLLLLANGAAFGASGNVEILSQPNPLSLQWLSVPDATRTRLRSGFDYNDANYDSGNLVRVEPAGMSFSNHAAVWVLFDEQGPGVITSLWFTGKNKQGQAFLGGRLNFYFDGEERPSLSGHLPEWLENNPFFPKGLAEKTSGGWIAYAPIYFQKSLKITLEDHADAYTHRQNGRGEVIPHIYHQFSWQSLSRKVSSSTPASLAKTPAWNDEPLPNWGTGHRFSLAPGERVEVVRRQGRGLLQALRLQFDQPGGENARFEVSADGGRCVAMTVAEFWGHARSRRPKAQFQSLLMGVDTEGRYYSRWPMPHRKELRVILISSNEPLTGIVQTAAREGWPQMEHFYFHASRITDRTEKGRDIVLLKTSGRGHYVGCILELANATLEGDERFYVDGEGFPPSWHGTGTEDYFRCGWYFHGGPLSRPLYGLLDGGTPKIAYRFHLADRVNFTRTVQIGFEHGHHNEYLGPYPGTVFWYSERPGAKANE